MTESIQGWKPPVIYDVSIDATRIATQGDINALTMVSRAYANLLVTLKQIDRDNIALAASLKEMAGRPND